MKAGRITALALAAAVALSAALDAHLIFGGSVKWKTLPVRYFVTNRDVPGVTAPQLEQTLDRAFEAWTGVPNTTISSEFAGFVSTEPSVEDLVSVIGFQNRPELERVLGLTDFHVVGGELVEADIFLNSTFNWSVAASGQAGRFDVQSIATHEVGHLLGLAHSALGETTIVTGGGRSVLGKRAVMFPIAYPPGNVDDRLLKPDDVAGISTIYGTPAFESRSGSITGRVLLGNTGIFGAHVVAINPTTGTMISGFSLDSQGRFTISGLDPGLYLVRVEPLDDADTNSFFSSGANVNANFKPMYFARLVPVPRGGAGSAIEIKVEPK